MLKLKNISKTFNKGTINEQVIFNNFNLEIAKGEFVVIIGSNGSGKSTLMNLISGNMFPDKGQIILDEKDVTNLPNHIRAKELGQVFQDPLKGTVSQMTVCENLALADKKCKRIGLRKCITADNIKEYKKLLSSLNLEDKINVKTGLLSGGQRQSITLLMATKIIPKCLLLDEHTSALDPKTADMVLNYTNNIIKENNLTVLMITHNMHDAIRFGTRLIMLNKGKIVMDIPQEEKLKISHDDLIKEFIKLEGV